MVALSDELANTTRSPGVRTAAGLQLKNSLTSKEDTIRAAYQARWLEIPVPNRQHVKTKVRGFLFVVLFCLRFE